MTRSTRLLLIVALLAAALAVRIPTGSAQIEDITVPEGTPIAVGDTVEGSLSADAPLASYSFEGAKGDAITIYVDDENDTVRYILIADEDGDVIYNQGFDPLYQHGAHIPLFFLPKDGVYNVAVCASHYYIYQEGSEEDTADFTLTLDTPDYTMVSYGVSLEGTLTPDHLYDMYVFEADEGDIPYATLDTAGSLELGLYSLAISDFQESKGNIPYGSSVSYITPRYLTKDGPYMVMVSRSLVFEDTPYTLTVEQYLPIELTADDPVEIDLTVEALTNYLTFEGEEDQVITVQADASEDINPTLVLFDPDADVVAVVENGDLIKDFVLKEDGEYVIAVFPGQSMIRIENLGTVKVTLTVDD